MKQLLLSLSYAFFGVCLGCSPAQTDEVEMNAMEQDLGGTLHLSSMGDVEAEHTLARIPAWLVGDWRISGGSDEEQGLVFRLDPEPSRCRVLRRQGEGWVEVGSMPYSWSVGERPGLSFTGRFHLTYTLSGLIGGGEEALVGHFSHCGSGLIYADHGVRLERVEIVEGSVVEDRELVRERPPLDERG